MITILTAASKAYWPLLSLTAPNKMEYCLRHGIQLVMRVHDDNVLTTAKPERLKFIQGALSDHMERVIEYCDPCWVWFMGADTLITNMTIDVNKMLEEFLEFDIVIAKDVNGINNDSFFIKQSAASQIFLTNSIKSCPVRSDDQEAMRFQMMETSYGLKVKCVDQKLFNAYKYDEYHYGQQEGTWEPGDFVLHLPGLPMDRRITLVREYLEKVVR